MRVVDEDRVIVIAVRAVRRSTKPTSNGRRRYADREVEKSLRQHLKRAPRAPHLVSRSAAAAMLGVASPYISRLIRQGRMPEPVEVEGGPDVYVADELKPLAKEMAAFRRRSGRGES